MSLPEKDRKDASKKDDLEGSAAPQFDALVPHSPKEIFGELDAYQKKIEAEWDTAKESYQNKVNDIMDEFLAQANKPEKPASKKSEAEKAASAPAPEPPATPPPLSPSPSSYLSKSPVDDKFDKLMEDVQLTLKKMERKSFDMSYPEFRRTPVINVSSRSAFSWLKRFVPVLAVIGLAGALVAVVWASFIQVPPVSPLPYQRTSGLSIIDNRIYIADWFRKTLFVHKMKKDLPIVSTENLPNSFTTGFAMRERDLISVNGMNGKIYEHANTVNHRVVNATEAEGSQLAGAFWDGFYFWVFDNGEGVLYQLLGNDFTEAKNTYGFTGGHVTAFHIQDNRIWILDGNSREIHVCRRQDPLRKLATFDLDPFIGNAVPTGIFVEEKKAWVVTQEPALLIKISRKKLAASDPKDF